MTSTTPKDPSLTLAGDPDKFNTEAAVAAHAQRKGVDSADDRDGLEVKKGNPVSRFVMKFCKHNLPAGL